MLKQLFISIVFNPDNKIFGNELDQHIFIISFPKFSELFIIILIKINFLGKLIYKEDSRAIIIVEN